MSSKASSRSGIQLGILENWAQFGLLILVNAFVGAMVGMERSILPAIAEEEFQMVARTAILSFIAVFGLVKAATNYFAGRLGDRFGRKAVLIGGWLIALPVPFLLMWAPTWGWIIFANVLLGASQGLTWSTTVIMKIDLAGPKNRGLAMGLNEFAGYFAVAGAALATGWVAANWGLRPEPFYLGVGFAVIGTLLSVFLVRETKGHALFEAENHVDHADHVEDRSALSAKEVFFRTTVTNPDLSSTSQAGFFNNLNDGLAWGLFPIFFLAAGMSLEQIGWLAAIYPAVWGIGQLFTGAWSDKVGRKWLIVVGMWTQAVGIGLTALSSQFWGFAVGAALMGAGTAMVYPTLLAAIGDVAHPTWRASSVGIYRLWRDSGYAAGALIAGVVADALGMTWALWLIAGLTTASGVVVAVRMRETLRAKPAEADAAKCVEVAFLREHLERDEDVLVVDVRSPEEYAEAHVDGAINVPLDEIEAHLDEFAARNLVVTVCNKGGGRSEQAASDLRAAGIGQARSLCGGTLAWKQLA
ncbi:MAG: MFS transporter [Persicimonas sp.]